MRSDRWPFSWCGCRCRVEVLGDDMTRYDVTRYNIHFFYCSVEERTVAFGVIGQLKIDFTYVSPLGIQSVVSHDSLDTPSIAHVSRESGIVR